MKTSEQCNEIIKALCEFQSKLKSVHKDATAHRYKYATLNAIWDEIRPILGEHGLYVFQDVCTENGEVNVLTRIFHTSGQWIETGYITIPMGKRDAHSTGSAQTYGRRYSLSAALGIVSDDDDDGAKAQEKAPEKPKQKDVNPVRWIEWAMEKLGETDGELLENYIEELIKATGKKRDTVIQLLGQDDDVFLAKYKLWLNDC